MILVRFEMLTRAQLEKLDHSELVNYSLSLSDIKDQLIEVEKNVTKKFEEEIRELKKETENRISKLDGELAIAKNANIVLREELDKQNGDLRDRLTILEKEAYRTAEYVNFETVVFKQNPIDDPRQGRCRCNSKSN